MEVLEKPQAHRPRLDIHGAKVPGADLSNTILHNANLAGANAAHANFSGADFKDANLDGTNLSGANLGHAKNLTIEQLSRALIDENTILPSYIDRSQLGLGRAD